MLFFSKIILAFEQIVCLINTYCNHCTYLLAIDIEKYVFFYFWIIFIYRKNIATKTSINIQSFKNTN